MIEIVEILRGIVWILVGIFLMLMWMVVIHD